jgi:hypothetical protein
MMPEIDIPIGAEAVWHPGFSQNKSIEIPIFFANTGCFLKDEFQKL